MSQSMPHDERRRELQADRALFGLTDAESRELAEILAADGGAAEDGMPDDLELTAAALDEAMYAESAEVEQPLPAHLRQRILDASKRLIPVPAAPALPSPAPAMKTLADASVSRGGPPSSGWRRREVLAWLAAAASLLVAFVAATRQSSREPSAADLRNRLLAERRTQPDSVVEIAWTRGADETGAKAEGDVLWSDRDQTGVMRFRGLAANDPTKTQYQLWIFDADRDERYPVDGGVFDVPAGATEVLVPIRAKLPVAHPKLFAITVEKPGGVVVSDRSRLPLLAPVE